MSTILCQIQTIHEPHLKATPLVAQCCAPLTWHNNTHRRPAVSRLLRPCNSVSFGRLTFFSSATSSSALLSSEDDSYAREEIFGCGDSKTQRLHTQKHRTYVYCTLFENHLTCTINVVETVKRWYSHASHPVCVLRLTRGCRTQGL